MSYCVVFLLNTLMTWHASHFFLGEYAGTVGWPSSQLLEMRWYFPRSHVWCLEESEKRAGEKPTQMQNYTPKFGNLHILPNYLPKFLFTIGINRPSTRPIDPRGYVGFFFRWNSRPRKGCFPTFSTWPAFTNSPQDMEFSRSEANRNSLAAGQAGLVVDEGPRCFRQGDRNLGNGRWGFQKENVFDFRLFLPFTQGNSH